MDSSQDIVDILVETLLLRWLYPILNVGLGMTMLTDADLCFDILSSASMVTKLLTEAPILFMGVERPSSQFPQYRY